MSKKKPSSPKITPTVSKKLPDGNYLELIYDSSYRKTSFIVGKGDEWNTVQRYQLPDGRILVPYSPSNSLLSHRVVLLPSRPEPFRSIENLVSSIRDYISQYVTVSAEYATVAAYYALLTWIYDEFNELPYLRAKGDFGSGKTRFLKTIGSICYKPMFASGASTISPIFHMIDAFRGTLIIDEADFRVSDDKAEIVKILNNGNARGFPVLRSEQSPTGEFRPRAFDVFGPKIVATRNEYDDIALESRFLTENMNLQQVGPTVPTTLPKQQSNEARGIRNRLLSFRLSWSHRLAKEVPPDPKMTPRMRQIVSPLISIASSESEISQIRSFVTATSRDLRTRKRHSVEHQLLVVLANLYRENPTGAISVGDVADHFSREYTHWYPAGVSARWIGEQLRSKLSIYTSRVSGKYILRPGQGDKLSALWRKNLNDA